MENTIFFTNQEEFRRWLIDHSETSKELWVGYFKKNTGRPSLTWSQSVDVALCFGWIDGVRNSIDEMSYKIRFTPRKPNSVWSAVNIKKVEDLIKQERMEPAGLHVFNNRSDAEGYSSDSRNILLDCEYESQIRTKPDAWKFFSNLAPSYKRDSIWWVMSAKKKETRLKRLAILISSSEAGLKIPMLRKSN